ncbi:hypothetical protein FSARC_7840 [Fusarium sarcochroum]|uniref:Infection structure specific protein n=1 Tax=Fusarium sarcochroum TaxID=1208366 RepID=A0A8H4TU51_9HYPO|nr:hypothetical protein FSARC_7840 [Fusarium sarcochroum]
MNTMRILFFAIVGALEVAAQTPTPTRTLATVNTYIGEACRSVEASLDLFGPPPPEDPELSEVVVSFAIGTLYNTQDPCELPVYTGTMADSFSEWASRWTSWEYEHVSEWRQIWSACSDEPSVTDLAPVGSDICSDLVAKITGAPTSDGKSDKGQDKDEGKDTNATDDKPEKVGESAGARLGGSFLAVFVAVGVIAVAL